MQAVLLKIIVTLGTQLMTEAFLGRASVLLLRYLAQKTTNTLDDSMVQELAKALNCSDVGGQK